MTTITDREAQRLSAPERLAQRWDETRPVETRPMANGVLIDWHRPTFSQRVRNAWRAALAELRR